MSGKASRSQEEGGNQEQKTREKKPGHGFSGYSPQPKSLHDLGATCPLLHRAELLFGVTGVGERLSPQCTPWYEGGPVQSR